MCVSHDTMYDILCVTWYMMYDICLCHVVYDVYDVCVCHIIYEGGNVLQYSCDICERMEEFLHFFYCVNHIALFLYCMNSWENRPPFERIQYVSRYKKRLRLTFMWYRMWYKSEIKNLSDWPSCDTSSAHCWVCFCTGRLPPSCTSSCKQMWNFRFYQHFEILVKS